jgi:hypothetical protein
MLTIERSDHAMLARPIQTILTALGLVRGRTALTAALPARARVDVDSWDEAWLRQAGKV